MLAAVFTGIIEHVAAIAACESQPGGQRLSLDLGPLSDGTRLGDSIAVSGACLTVARLDGQRVGFDVSAETLRKTTLGSWRSGTLVNLERALVFGARLGGHLVSGHIDGVGRLLERRPDGQQGERFTFLLADTVMVVEKGSLTIDGISLTTWDCHGRRCSVAVIPHTLAHTTLGGLRAGALVNLEQDVVGRWVEAMANRTAEPPQQAGTGA